jgi:16S rRNA (cytosine1402-N4)-methyltransferase
MDYHFSVLSDETINLLDVTPNQIYIDATLGNGGHTLEILKKGGIVYGIDLDVNNLKLATERINQEGFKDNFIPVHSNFVNIKNIYKNTIKNKVNGIIFDLGLSRNQQKSQKRGFSFDDTESLDMRLDPKLQTLTAEEIINTAPFEELYEIFSKYGQEIYTKPLILRIIRERQKSPIKTGKRLADIVREYYQKHHFKSKIDPSTKIFLSLRIAVNDEFENLKKALLDTLDIVEPNGKVCVISFHSGEDRIAKQFIKEQERNNKITGLTSKGIQPKFEEIKINPLSRSAILRSFKIV